jgi:hypothetical protein
VWRFEDRRIAADSASVDVGSRVRGVPAPAGVRDRRAVVSRPLGECPHEVGEAPADRGEVVLDLRRDGRMNRPGQYAVALEATQGEGEHPLRDARNRTLELAEPPHALSELDDGQDRPLTPSASYADEERVLEIPP